jgi:hypothetical protein
MDQEVYKARQVREKTQQVIDHHNDDTKPGKPLYLLIPGGLIALACLGLIILIAYRVWLEGSMDQGTGLTLIGILAPFYVGGVFLFSYGYELFNLWKAIRLTAIIVFITVGAVVIIAVLFLVLSNSSGSSRSSGSKTSSSRTVSGNSPSGGFGGFGGVGPLIFLGGSPQPTVTREVVHESAPQPEPPKPIECPYCGRSYIPAETKFICPSCGAATPADLAPAPKKT